MNPPDSLNPGRLKVAVIGGTITYGAATYGLYQAWYRDYESGSFKFNNDWGQWKTMDKVGHFFTTWFESYFVYKGTRWCGMDEKAAVWTGAGTAMLFQTTVEIMDGFLREWGFSWYDMAFNAIGAGSFLFQQLHWGEQRIVFKFSANYVDYDPTFFGPVEGDATQRSSRKIRANDLFGSGSLPRMIKDYNGQTYWASLNIASFIKDRTGFPGWLNIAAGYGATNMYGAHDNTWDENDATFYIEDPRLHSFYLSTDIDLRKIKSKSAVVRTILDILNLIKIPLPTLEFRSDGQINWHWVYF